MDVLTWLLAYVVWLASLVGGSVEVQPSPVPTIEPTAEPASLRDIICSYDWPCEEALAVAHCESRFVATATGSVGERGWFQLRPEFHQWRADAAYGPGADLYDPVVNTAAAYSLWTELGWQPWSCRP